MSENRLIWLRTVLGQMVIMRYEKGKQQEEEDVAEDKERGPTYLLVIPRPNARPVKLNITALTLEELELTRQFFNRLFDLAEPIVKHRDKVAEDAAAEGDDSYARIYRQVPQFIDRAGEISEHDQRLLDGLEDVSDGSGDGDRSEGLRGSGDVLAPEEQESGRPQDDGSETDEPEGV